MLRYYLIRPQGQTSCKHYLALCPLHTLRISHNFPNWGNSCGLEGHKKTNEQQKTFYVVQALTHPSFYMDKTAHTHIHTATEEEGK